MENKNKKDGLGESTYKKNGQAGQKGVGTSEESTHAKHVEAGHKGAEACCKKMGPSSACCGKK